jgi:hypothetical protein
MHGMHDQVSVRIWWYGDIFDHIHVPALKIVVWYSISIDYGMKKYGVIYSIRYGVVLRYGYTYGYVYSMVAKVTWKMVW